MKKKNMTVENAGEERKLNHSYVDDGKDMVQLCLEKDGIFLKKNNNNNPKHT